MLQSTSDRLPLLKSHKDAIESIIKNLPKFIKGLSIDYFKIMDNHIHIIFIFKDCTRPLGRVVSAMKYSITKSVTNGISACEKVNGNFPATQQCSGGTCLRANTHRQITIPPKKANSNLPATKETIWQWNYYEHIIRNEESSRKIREYIDNNPLVERIDWKHLDVSSVAVSVR